MPEHYIPRSTTLSDVLATHSRQIAHLMRQLDSVWTVLRLVEAQQADERAQWRRDAAAARDAEIAGQQPFDFTY